MANEESRTTTVPGTDDPLTVSLRLLTHADVAACQAVQELCGAIYQPVQVPVLVKVAFTLHNVNYHARVTAEHGEQILDAVGDGGDVLMVVNLLLGNLTKAIAGDLNTFVKVLGDRVADDQKADERAAQGTQPIPVGCCTYPGGQTANLTQTQCAQYSNSTWKQGDCPPLTS